MLKVRIKGEDIKFILTKKNLSQTWLAKRLGITSGFMSQLLNEKKSPSPKTRKKFMDYFKEQEFDDLFYIS
jgi:transcriptional regulator with XRE-family HTH domain